MRSVNRVLVTGVQCRAWLSSWTKRLSAAKDVDDKGKTTVKDVGGLGKRIRPVIDRQKNAFLSKLRNVGEKYEELVGLADVQEAQRKVKEAEALFLEARSKERTVLRQMVETREKLKNVRERLSHVDYSNPMYLQLASDQHELVNEEEKQKRELEEVEDHERDSFLNLSTAMRESYEEERARVERTKNWSIFGTLIGTMIGMLGSIYMNRVRTKDLMKAVTEKGNNLEVVSKVEMLASDNKLQNSAIVTAVANMSENISALNNALQVQNLQAMAGFVTDSMSGEHNNKSPSVRPQNSQMQSASMQALTNEISSYNLALSSLVKAVTALSDADLQTDAIETSKLEDEVNKQSLMLKSIQKTLADIISFANENGFTGINNQLEDIGNKLNNLLFIISCGDVSHQKEGPIIHELPPEVTSKRKPDLYTGIKDAVLWGSIMCCLYMFIKF